jgi:hypothetical protein
MDKTVKNINICKIDKGRWTFKGSEEQESRELGVKSGESVLLDSPVLISLSLLD